MTDFSLLPADDEGIPPTDDVDAAASSALDAGNLTLAETETPEPFGRTPLFDFEAGRMVRAGTEPVWVSGHAALEQWCLMSAYTARFAHPVFPDEFGTEDPDGPLGEVVDLYEKTVDWAARLREGWLMHDRISDVTDLDDVTFDSSEGVLTAGPFTVVTDEDETIQMGAFRLPVLGRTDG